MGAIRAFSVTADALGRNPVLLAGAAIVGVGSTVMNAAGLIPLVGLLVGLLYFFVEPLLAGGYLGMANQAVSGDAGLDDFWSSAKENYTDLLLARLIVAVPAAVFALLFGFVGVLLIGVSVMNAAEPGATGGSLEAVGVLTIVVFAVGFLLFAIPVFLLQFYPAAIVIGDAGPVESFKYSVLLVKRNVLAALGYTAVAFALGLLLVAPQLLAGGGQVVGQAVGERFLGDAAGGLVSGLIARFVVFSVAFFVVKTLVVATLRTYYVSFVRVVSGTA